MTAPFEFDYETRAPSPALAPYCESLWFARGTVPYTRERIAPTGSTVAIVVLGDPILATDTQLRDHNWVMTADQDRGFDTRRAYQANDPRRWYRGNIAETTTSDRRFSRYAMSANQRKHPRLGYGHDPREIKQVFHGLK